MSQKSKLPVGKPQVVEGSRTGDVTSAASVLGTATNSNRHAATKPNASTAKIGRDGARPR
eukprot:5309084-Prymnesium_polylepis.3